MRASWWCSYTAALWISPGYSCSFVSMPTPTALCLVQAAAVNTDTPIIVVLIHGGPLDVSWLEQSDRIHAILSAWHPGQVSVCCLLMSANMALLLLLLAHVCTTAAATAANYCCCCFAPNQRLHLALYVSAVALLSTARHAYMTLCQMHQHRSRSESQLEAVTCWMT